ncbi:hypothetical protein FHG64_15200 [Antarcticibacterium flavum]|uniref:Uncharacterized protein n=1 Tax=Antarcticibacterium flavum TaxID=2058175 RepID=A0A5B7X5B4_9FLAO|nr:MULTISPECIES: hypothetical protein [Antarcticibacterium]MCM4159697.1 hypothetical protein [Antarcticibacterium sp. W02-3]QCY70636.1 hypothetical protein FHG64_15200 [Antarcticibacterium flavum]
MKAIFKYGLLFIFLIATLFHNIRFTYLVSFYTLNNESFTELFCQNKDKPELECNGQCTIIKAGEDLNKEKNELALLSFQQEITYYISVFYPLDETTLIVPLPQHFYYQNKYNFLFSQKIVHPPIALS